MTRQEATSLKEKNPHILDFWSVNDLMRMVMTVEEYKQCVSSGGFIDYDGFGYLIYGDRVTREETWPSIVDQIPSDVTHIIWYNK